jgi:ZIP family zinc transporter
LNIILLSLLAGVCGMGLGSVLTVFIGGHMEKMVSILLSFAGGVMISIVFLELLPVAIDHSGYLVSIFGIIFGAFLVWVLNLYMDKRDKPGKKESEVHDSYVEFFHSSDIITRKKNMIRSGMVMLFAIGIHNVPEGLAMGAAGYHDITLGITIAIAIGIHNIPEGMAISAPLLAGGLSKIKTVSLTLMAGATTVFGAIAGVLIGGISDFALAFSFSVAGGSMLYVVIAEILPQSIVTNKTRVPTLFALLGIIVGMIFTGPLD